MKSICIITPRYPTDVDKTAMAFVQQFAWALADIGIKVDVICPLAANINTKFKRLPDVTEEITSQGKKVRVYLPKFFGFGQRNIAFFNTARLTTNTFQRAVEKVFLMMKEKPDVLYGHFVTPSGITACQIGKKYNLPAFIGYGESSTWSIDHYGRRRVKNLISNVKGIIAVSTKNKEEIVETGIVNGDKVGVFPNGYNPSRFFIQDRKIAREMFNLPQDVFIVGFVGHFIKRKGIDILSAAINNIPDAYMICAGKGELKPEGKQVLYADLVSPDKLSFFYSAADIFVLPTHNEGCCNAIIEAMACGLPIVSSKQSFNNDILSEKNSIRIDSNSIQEVSNAIQLFMTNSEMLNSYSKESLRMAEKLTISKRVNNIVSFMNNME